MCHPPAAFVRTMRVRPFAAALNAHERLRPIPRAARGGRVRRLLQLVALAGLLPSGAGAEGFPAVVGVSPALRGELEIHIVDCRPTRGASLMQAELSAQVLGQREFSIDQIECGAYRPGTDEVKYPNSVNGFARLSPGEAFEKWVLFPFDAEFSECRCRASGIQPFAATVRSAAPARVPSVPPALPELPATPRGQVPGESSGHEDVDDPVGHDEPERPTVVHASGRRFTARPFEEAGASGHHHAVVAVDGLDLIVVRDEAAYKTPLDRAEALSRALEESMHQGDRLFVFDGGAERPAIYVASHHGEFPRLLLRVTRADAAAYTRRSGRRISQTLLGEWWTSLLKDYHSILFSNQMPRFVTGTHEGESLVLLHSRMAQDAPAPQPPSSRVASAVSALSAETRGHLKALASRVPKEFAPRAAGPKPRIEQLDPL